MRRARSAVPCPRSPIPSPPRAASGARLWPLSLAAAPAWAQAAADGAGLVAPNVCLLTPETTEGPYYIDPDLVRADITEGLPGVPLELVLQVVDADCGPVEGARVDVWHCDAAGNYSGYRPAGQRPGPRHPRRDLPARHAVRRRRRRRAVPQHLARLVPRADAACPLQGLPRRADGPDQPALLSRRRQRDGVSRRRPTATGRPAQDTTNASDGIARRAGPRAFAAVARPARAGGRSWWSASSRGVTAGLSGTASPPAPRRRRHRRGPHGRCRGRAGGCRRRACGRSRACRGASRGSWRPAPGRCRRRGRPRGG